MMVNKNCTDCNRHISDFNQMERSIIDGEFDCCINCMLDRIKNFVEVENKLNKIILNLKEKKIWEQIKVEIEI